jgi:hypothetical protein
MRHNTYFSCRSVQNIILIISVLSFMSFTGCSSSNDYKPEKMDTALRQKLDSLEKENSDISVNLLGKCNTAINSDIENELMSTGITLQSTAGDIFTARGDYKSIKKVSALDIVTSLELERRMELK